MNVGNVERFNRTYRGKILTMYVFRKLTEVRELTESWMSEYNDERPHDSLEDLTPFQKGQVNTIFQIAVKWSQR